MPQTDPRRPPRQRDCTIKAHRSVVRTRGPVRSHRTVLAHCDSPGCGWCSACYIEMRAKYPNDAPSRPPDLGKPA